MRGPSGGSASASLGASLLVAVDEDEEAAIQRPHILKGQRDMNGT